MLVGYILEFVGGLLHHLHNNNDAKHEQQQQQQQEQDFTSHDDAYEESEAKREIAEEPPRPISPEEQSFALSLSSMKKRQVAPLDEKEEEEPARASTKVSARDDIVPSTTSSLSDVGERQEQQPPHPQQLHQQRREAVSSTRSVVAMAKTNNPHKSSLPLSMRLMQHVSGIAYCQDCAIISPPNSPVLATPTTSNTSNSRNSEDEVDDADNQLLAAADSLDYDFQALQRQRHSSTSPLLLVQRRPLYPHQSTMERILTEYMAACRFYGCGNRINSGVLTTLRFSLPALRVSADFYNADMLALCEILLHHANGALSYIRRLDFSLSGLESSKSAQHGQRGRHDAPSGFAPGLTSHGALTLSKVLHVARHIEEVNLRRNNIGPFGASAIFLACFENPYSRVGKINMRRCRVGEHGALVLAELLAKSHDKKNHEGSSQVVRPLSLREIDLSSNYIGVQGCVELDRALQQHHKALLLSHSPGDETTRTTTTTTPNHRPLPISINLEGNLVFSEVMNGVTHGLGSLLSLVAVYVMHQQVRDKDWFHVASCAVYSASLVILYISSTLFHSFFSMQQTKYIFQAIDKCAIYLLIAGTYTPYLLIMMMPERPDFTMAMLAVLWSGCFLGIGVEAFWKEWTWRGTFSLSMYLGMGWSALAGYSVLAPIIPTQCIYLLVAGGVTYTLGVPFFVRDGYLDHAIWHIFVLAASIFHWLSIYWYVATWPTAYVVENDSTVTMVATALATLVPSSCPGVVESPAAPPVLEMLLTQA